MAVQLDREDLEEIEHLPAQKNDGDQDHHDGNGLSEIQAGALRLKTLRHQSENIEGSEAED